MPGLTILIAALAAPDPGLAPIQLGLPIACEPGQTCFVQNYFDADPGPGVRDYACGSISYDSHDGTDIRLPSLAEMRRGVDVLAAAPGVVEGSRDGLADISIRESGAPSVKGRECGNGVAVVHSGGWRTQYCHLKRGSVRVKSGQTVRAGEALGQVGLSGDTEFPHLHLSVTRHGKAVDPFGLGAKAGACRSGTSLWRPEVAARLAYRSPTQIAAGFAAGAVTAQDVDEGRAGRPAPNAGSPALVAFTRAIGLEKGDAQTLKLIGPDGKVVAEQTVPPLDRAKAVWMMFAGKKAPPSGFARGSWRATYSVRRGGRVVLERSWTISL